MNYKGRDFGGGGMSERQLAAIETSLAVQAEREKALLARFDDLKEQIDGMRVQINSIEDMANRWRGGFIVLMGLSGVAGMMAAFWDRIGKVFGPIAGIK